MIVLGVILEDLRFLLVVEVLNEIISPEFFSPFFAIYEPASPLASHIAIPKTRETDISFAASTLNFLARKNLSY